MLAQQRREDAHRGKGGPAVHGHHLVEQVVGQRIEVRVWYRPGEAGRVDENIDAAKLCRHRLRQCRERR